MQVIGIRRKLKPDTEMIACLRARIDEWNVAKKRFEGVVKAARLQIETRRAAA